MAKVVTESPRGGHGNSNHKHGGRLHHSEIDRAREDDEDCGPSGMIAWSRHRNKDCKEFSDLLGPLRRYLQKQVGRPWNNIHSELCENLDKRSLSGIHIWGHVNSEVEQRCEERADGKIYRKAVQWHKHDRPVEGLFVHPRTNLLCYIPRKRYRYGNAALHELRRTLEKYDLLKNLKPTKKSLYVSYKSTQFYNEKEIVPVDWVIVDEYTILQRVKGIWMVHKFKALNPEDVISVKVIHGRDYPVTRGDIPQAKLWQHMSTHQVGRREKKLWALSGGR